MAGTEETTQVVHGHPVACHVMTRMMATARKPSSDASRVVVLIFTTTDCGGNERLTAIAGASRAEQGGQRGRQDVMASQYK